MTKKYRLKQDKTKRNKCNPLSHIAVNDNFGYTHLYKRRLKEGTTFFDVLYYYWLLFHKHKHPITVAAVGNDMIYSKQGDTFYSHLSLSSKSRERSDPVKQAHPSVPTTTRR
jgi:hypothetical protein